jgi:aminoglycoside phosphotransferase (APT) family kinase protein
MSDTIQVRQGEELDIPALDTFLLRHVEGYPEDGELTVRQFALGHSNLTYELGKGAWKAVLRRPPHGPVAPKAHDMRREYIVLGSVSPLFPAAPRPYLYSDDTSVVGSPFLLMERKEGIVLDTDFPEGLQPTRELCREISERMADTLADLHRVEYAGTELAAISHPEGFMARQAEGWIDRYERSKTDDLPEVEPLKKWLLDRVPESREAAIIHYDFKLNNAMFAPDFSRVTGLFDWEMSTVGDPLADLGAAMSYWVQGDDPEPLLTAFEKPPVTVMDGFLTRREFMERYAQKSGRDISAMPYYITFAYFKLAVICQQIYYRWKKGQTKDERFARFGLVVRNLVQMAREMSAMSRW